MPFAVVGLSHRTCPVEVRERVAVPPAELPDALATLRQIPGIRDGLLVSTCNRTEVYAVVDNLDRDLARLQEFVAAVGKVPLAELESYLYSHGGPGAVRHIFRVAASLDSMILGESQILGQVRAAFSSAQAAESASGLLVRLMERAFAVAKRVRSETALGDGNLSVASAAVELAKTIFGDLTARSVLLVGAGKMGRLTLKHLHAEGIHEIFLANRSRERVAEVFGEDEMLRRYVPLERVLEMLERVDIALSSIPPDGYLLDHDRAIRLQRKRRGRPLFLVDIAVPRSLDPAVHRVENIFLYDIDDLRGVVEKNRQARNLEAERAERIVEAEVSGFVGDLRELDVVPAIRALLDRLEAVRRLEIDRYLAGRPDLGPEALEAIEAATRSMMNKVAHGPIQELKRATSAPQGQEAIELLRRAMLVDIPAGEERERLKKK